MTWSRLFAGLWLMILLVLLLRSFVFAPLASAQNLDEPEGPRSLDQLDLSSAQFEALRTLVHVAEAELPLSKWLREISRQASIDFIFSTDLVDDHPPTVSILEELPAVEAIVRALRGSRLEAFLLQDGKIIVTSRGSRSLPPEDPGSTRPVPATQTIRGHVFDRDSRLPLPGANIVLPGTDPLLGTTSDLSGAFVLPGIPVGRHNIQVSFIGFDPQLISGVLLTSSKELVLEIGLKEQVLRGEEIVVRPALSKDRPLNDMAMVSARSFSVEETRRYAGGADDPARMASAFAGVTAGAGVGDNALIIRGNAPKGVLWRLEGVEIPNPNHFAGMVVAGGGGLTLFSSQLLADSDFMTSAFPAEYGNALAGVFDMNFRTGNPATREHAVQIGVMGIDLASEGPILTGKPSAYLFNYRYSTLGLVLPLLPTEDVATYQDLSFKFAFPLRNGGRLEWWGVGGLDAQRMTETPDQSEWEYELWDRTRFDLSLGVGATGLSHTLLLGKRSFLKTTAALTANRTRLDQQRLDDEAVLQEDVFISNTDGRFIFNSYLNHKFGARHVNRTGIGYQRLFYDLQLDASLGHRPPPVTISSGSGAGSLLRFYTQSSLDLHPALSLNVGIHGQHFTLSDRSALEPRLGLRVTVNPKTAITAGYGLHSRIEDLRIYLITSPTDPHLAPNRDLDFTRAHHLVAGINRKVGNYARVKLEGYYQHLFNAPVIADSSFSMLNFEQDWTFSSPLSNAGRGRNYGIELTVERFLNQGYYYLATASLFSSEYRGGDHVWRRSRFDSRYALNGLFGKEFSINEGRNVLGLNGRVAFLGGKRRSPVDLARSLARQEVVLDENRAFQERGPSLFLLDATVTYRMNRGRVSHVLALQLKNALATKEVYPEYNFKAHDIEEIHEGYPLPILSYRIEF